MKSEELPELPSEFYPESNNPDEVLENLWNFVTGYRITCKNCKEKQYSSKIYQDSIKPWIKHTNSEKTNNQHPLFQIKSWYDLFTIECPKCGQESNFKGDDVDDRF